MKGVGNFVHWENLWWAKNFSLNKEVEADDILDMVEMMGVKLAKDRMEVRKDIVKQLEDGKV